jgi:hypothetical protein
MTQPPATQTTLPLLESLINVAVPEKGSGTRFRLERVRLTPSAVVLDLGVRNLTRFVDGTYALELVVRETRAAETRFHPRWSQPEGLARLVSFGARLAPRGLLNEALQHLFGEWMRVEGEEVVLDHQAMIAALAEKRRGAAGVA